MKIRILAVLTAALLGSACFAADLNFKPDGGGYFIYCNNNESIRRCDLSDISNSEPAYIMNNINMTYGKYTLYFSHLNRTEVTAMPQYPDSADADKKEYTDEETEKLEEIVENGFDVEVDVLFRAKTDTKIRLTALGFEVQQPRDYYNISSRVRIEEAWGCLGAVASYMERPVYGLGTASKFLPHPIEDTEIIIKEGECVWLSEYIENYARVPWLKPVHLLCDFEIVYGCTDINIAALKSGDILGDRSNHVYNAAHGRYYRDRQYKGVAETLPSVSAELSYTIDDTVKSGDKLPVTVYNVYVPEGNETREWVTHFSPHASRDVQRIAAASDMLRLEYFDPSKKTLYNDDVSMSERSKIWKFDIYHSDTRCYDPLAGMETESGFEPNYILPRNQHNARVGANLANYCVNTNYVLTVENKSDRERYFCYNARTDSSIVVSVKDKNGYTAENAVHKAYKNGKEEETLGFYPLKPNSVSEFVVTVFLPVNYVGGIRNSFMIADEKPLFAYKEDNKQRSAVNPDFTGRDLVKWEDGYIMRSDNGSDPEKIIPSDEVRRIFEGNADTFRLVYGNGYYAVLPYTYVNTPSYYTKELKYLSRVYFISEDFRRVHTAEFESYPTEVSCAAGKWYVKAGKKFVSENFTDWTEASYQDLGLPVDNGSGKIIAPRADGEVFLSADGGESFQRIAYRADVRKPYYLNVAGDAYYYVEGKWVNISLDGVEWTRIGEAKSTVTDIFRVGNEFVINGGERFEIPEIPDYTNVIVLDEVMQYDRQVKNYGYGVSVPVEMTAEKLGAEYEYDEGMRRLTVKHGGKTARITVGSSAAVMDGKRYEMSTRAAFAYSRVFVPLDFFELFGFETEYKESARMGIIKAVQN